MVMKEGRVISDARLLGLLGLGDALLRAVDPGGLFRGGRVVFERHDSGLFVKCGKSFSWCLEVAFPAGLRVMLSGCGRRDGVLSVSALSILESGRAVAVRVRPSSSISDALGDLSRIPGSLKAVFSLAGREVAAAAGDEVVWNPGLLMTERNALFLDVEGGRVKDDWRDYFSRYENRFVCGVDGSSDKVAMTAAARSLGGARIIVGAEACVFGVGTRKVLLESPFAGGAVSCDCVRFIEGEGGRRRRVPSIDVAFELMGMLAPPQEPCERKNRKGLFRL